MPLAPWREKEVIAPKSLSRGLDGWVERWNVDPRLAFSSRIRFLKMTGREEMMELLNDLLVAAAPPKREP